MGVKLKGGVVNFLNTFEQAEQIMIEEIMTGLTYLGEECVKQIRERKIEEGSWRDQTGNLRSSIGYAVMDHGAAVIRSAFKVVKNGGQGAQIGEKYVSELASRYANVYALVVVAGMNYAEAVEARGRDVLSGTSLWAEQRIDKVLKTYTGRAERRINALFNKL